LGERLFLKTDLEKGNCPLDFQGSLDLIHENSERGINTIREVGERERHIYIYVSMRGVRTYLYERSICIGF
jgi:hypothetical protein